jgi:hypothetical protein
MGASYHTKNVVLKITVNGGNDKRIIVEIVKIEHTGSISTAFG